MLLLLVAESVSDSLATPWTVACQTPLFMAFSRQEYWNELPCPPPGDIPHPGIEPAYPHILHLLHCMRILYALSHPGSPLLASILYLKVNFSLSCIGEGNGKPLQCSCLENPRDGGAWWAAVYGAAQSRPLLKQLSSSSSSSILYLGLPWWLRW